MSERIILLGAGGHARSMVDTIEALGRYEIAGFVMPEQGMEMSFRSYHTIGTDHDLREIYSAGIRKACIGIGYLGRKDVRRRVYESLKEIGFEMPNIIDNTAVIASDVKLDEGCFIGKKAVVNTNAQIGKCVIVNTGAIIEHDCCVGDFSHISVGSTLCGEVCVGEHAMIGANATVIQGRSIGNNSIVGANSTVLIDVEDDMKVYGIVKEQHW